MTSEGLPSSVSDDEVKQIMQRVLNAEKQKLHMSNPKGINNEIEKILKEEVD
jgi:hypothetical protein